MESHRFVNFRLEVASFNNPRIFLYTGVALPLETCVQVVTGSNLSWAFDYFKYFMVLHNLLMRMVGHGLVTTISFHTCFTC
jgi:hypothetical protein